MANDASVELLENPRPRPDGGDSNVGDDIDVGDDMEGIPSGASPVGEYQLGLKLNSSLLPLLDTPSTIRNIGAPTLKQK